MSDNVEKIFTATAKKYDDNGLQEVEVTYHFDTIQETGGAFIWCEYEDVKFMRLTQNNGELPNKAWTYMLFHYAMYWLVTPLLYAGVIRMNFETSLHPNKAPRNLILVEVAEEYLVN